MRWTILRRVILTCSAATALLAAPDQTRADCFLTDWLFGHGQTTYAPPYCPPNAYSPAAAPACGCAPAQCVPVQPSCQPCMPTATYRISYRPVWTVAYKPVVGVDPCSGCAVTTYRPTQALTYQASLQPYPTYRVGYAPAVIGVGSCGSCCGCAPCSGYSSVGCSSCGTSYGGCSSCSVGGYVTSGGCSSCPSSSTPLPAMTLPGPGDMSRPPVASSTLIAPSGSTTLGPPTAPPVTPGASSGSARTYVPGTTGAPIAPSAPGPSASPSGGYYRGPTSNEGGTTEPLKIQGIPPLPSGPQLNPPQSAHPESENQTTSQPVKTGSYFQLLPSPPRSVPAQLISAPEGTTPHVDDSGWKHVDN